MEQLKLFSVAKAERALPLVKRIVADIVQASTKRETALKERYTYPRHPNPGSRQEEEAFRTEREVLDQEALIRRCVRELEDVGVELKDPSLGLVDFFSFYRDQVVLLCWKLDEGDCIRYWHSLEDGFRGRQPITETERAAFKGD